MGFFSFNNDFEVIVNYPNDVTYKKFMSYIKNKGWKTIYAKELEKISFQTKTTLISWPINFEIDFIANDNKSTTLSVKASAAHLDMGRSKGIVNDIINEIY